MTTTTKFNLWTLVLIAIVAYAFFSAVDVFADNRPAQMFAHRDITGKATHTEKVWSVQHSDAIGTLEITELPLVPLYACTYSSNGVVIECVFIGWGDPNAPEL
jgi:hypothetical protein